MLKNFLTACSSAVLVQCVFSYDLTDQGRYLYNRGEKLSYSFIGAKDLETKKNIYDNNKDSVSTKTFEGWKDSVFGTTVTCIDLKKSFGEVQTLFNTLNENRNSVKNFISIQKGNIDLSAAEKNGLGILETLLGNKISEGDFYSETNISDIQWYMYNWRISDWYTEFCNDIQKKTVINTNKNKIKKEETDKKQNQEKDNEDIENINTKDYRSSQDPFAGSGGSSAGVGDFSVYSVHDEGVIISKSPNTLNWHIKTESSLQNTMYQYLEQQEGATLNEPIQKINQIIQSLGLNNETIDRLDSKEKKGLAKLIAIRKYICTEIMKYMLKGITVGDILNITKMFNTALSDNDRNCINERYANIDIINLVLSNSNFSFINSESFKKFYKEYNSLEQDMNDIGISFQDSQIQLEKLPNEAQVAIARLVQGARNEHKGVLVTSHSSRSKERPEKEFSLLKYIKNAFFNRKKDSSDNNTQKNVGIAGQVFNNLQNIDAPKNINISDEVKADLSNTSVIYLYSTDGEIEQKADKKDDADTAKKINQEREKAINDLRKSVIDLINEELKQHVNAKNNVVFCLAKELAEDTSTKSAIDSTKECIVLETLKFNLLYILANAIKVFWNDEADAASLPEDLKNKVDSFIAAKIQLCQPFIKYTNNEGKEEIKEISLKPERIRGYSIELNSLKYAINDCRVYCTSPKAEDEDKKQKCDNVYAIIQHILDGNENGIISPSLIYTD